MHYLGCPKQEHGNYHLKKTVKVIDLFAGPGGLGEGFFSYTTEDLTFPFEGFISVEKDLHAHSTLTLRAFYRLLKKSNIPLPDEYFRYIKGETQTPSNSLTEKLWMQAQSETLLLEMGKDTLKDKVLFTKLRDSLHSEYQPTLLIGGPPCQAYSLVGRARNKGNKSYIPEKDHRHFLYKEYLSIMSMFSPDVFIMENVKGMLSSKINGGAVFDQILKDLEECSSGYSLFSLKTGKKFIRGTSNPRDFILCAEDYGVPQNRHRVIILGVKNTFKKLKTLSPLTPTKKVTVKSAISDLPSLRSPISNRGSIYKEDSLKNWKQNLKKGVALLCKDTSLSLELKNLLKQKLTIVANSELTSICDAIYSHSVQDTEFNAFVKDSPQYPITSHESRPHMDTDLLRYYFCSCFRELFGRSARAEDFPKGLTPAHKNWLSGKFVDRFKVQYYNSQSSTITSHISKDGHYFIHSEPTQCRSLTVREAARLQTFPDSYQFMGKRTNQYHQVGNAVPPLLAKKIADVVSDLF